MPDQQDTKPKPCCGGLFRFHRSTLVIVSLLLVPWLLVALPGRADYETYLDGVWLPHQAGVTTSHQQHGLPFTWLERQAVFASKADPTVDYDAQAAKYLANWEHEQEVLLIRCLLNRPSIDLWQNGLEFPPTDGQGFWSDADRWPWIGKANGEAMRIHWWGLLADALLVLLVAFLFARFVEYRLNKRGSHFVFSLAEMLVVTCATGVFLTWGAVEHRRASQENTIVDQFMAIMSETDGYLNGDRCNSLPVVVSELFDHRSSLPPFNTPLFRPVEQADISLPNDPEGYAGGIIDAIGSIHFTIDLDVNVNQSNLPILVGIKDSLVVKSLDLDFDFDTASDNAYGDQIDLGFKLVLPAMENLSISLQPGIDQKKQLGIFAFMKNIKRLEIYGLNRAGATYLNSIAKDLPSDTLVLLDSNDEKLELLAPMKLERLSGESPFDP